MNPRHCVVAVSLALVLAAPAWAQQSQPLSTSDPAKAQVRTFELALRSAVDTGTRNFAQRASELVPELFSVVDAPAVNGVAVHVLGRTEYVFHIQVPTIWPVVQVMSMMNQRSLRTGLPPGGGAQPVADGARARPNGVNPSDQADGPAVNASNRPELEREYAMKVRDALIDAIIDNSGVLPLASTDTLVVFASGSDTGIPQSLYQAVPRKLILSIAGSDLADLRQGKITRDEARAKVVEEHF
jgi:hypothetical protein